MVREYSMQTEPAEKAILGGGFGGPGGGPTRQQHHPPFERQAGPGPYPCDYEKGLSERDTALWVSSVSQSQEVKYEAILGCIEHFDNEWHHAL